jgi:hypothetical protein
MAQRSLLRELALLTVPVVLVGFLGVWLSKRPSPPLKEPFTFRIDKPTILEAFSGAEGAFVVKAEDSRETELLLNTSGPVLELMTSDGTTISSQDRGEILADQRVLRGILNNSRFTFNLRSVPEGALYFPFRGTGTSYQSSANATPLAPIPLNGRWKVDRTKVQPFNFATLAREPLICVKAIKIKDRRRSSNNVTGEIIFSLDGPGMDSKTTPLDVSFSCRHYGMSWGIGNSGTPETARTRVYEWTAQKPSTGDLVYVSGRISADKH